MSFNIRNILSVVNSITDVPSWFEEDLCLKKKKKKYMMWMANLVKKNKDMVLSACFVVKTDCSR